MNNITFKETTPVHIREEMEGLIKDKTEEELIDGLKAWPGRIADFLRWTHPPESLAVKLIYLLNPKDKDLKNVESALRNRGLLNREADESRVVLALECPSLHQVKDTTEAEKTAIQYLYLPDDQRERFVGRVDPQLLLGVLKAAHTHGLLGLTGLCDTALCNHLAEIKEIDFDPAKYGATKLPLFLKFIEREGVDLGHLENFAAKATPEEAKVFVHFNYDLFSLRLLNSLSFDETLKTRITELRNKGLFKRGDSSLPHQALIASQSDYFANLFKWNKDSQVKLEGFSEDVFNTVIDFLYLPDQERNLHFKPEFLWQLVKCAAYCEIPELIKACDIPLSTQITHFDAKELLELNLPQAKMFTALSKFIQGLPYEPSAILKEMEKAPTELVEMCTPDEITTFSVLENAFGKACKKMILSNLYGQEFIDASFKGTRVIPPLPEEAWAFYLSDDPEEPGLKRWQTGSLFPDLPDQTINSIPNMERQEGVPELKYEYISPPVKQAFGDISAQKPCWVWMRNTVSEVNRGEDYAWQKDYIERKGDEVPEVRHAILLNLCHFIRTGNYLFGQNPWTLTRCKEYVGATQTFQGNQVVVGGFASLGLPVSIDYFFAPGHVGMAGCRKFPV